MANSAAGGSVTVTWVVACTPDWPATEAVMVAVPAAMAVTRPLELTVATAVADDVKLTAPVPPLTVAVIVAVSPTARLRLAGVTEIVTVAGEVPLSEVPHPTIPKARPTHEAARMARWMRRWRPNAMRTSC